MAQRKKSRKSPQRNNPVTRDVSDQSNKTTIAKVEQTTYHGPIPDPATLEAYKNIDPEIPGLIIKNFLEESNHRRGLEKSSMKLNEEIYHKNSSRKTRGQILGFGIGIGGLITSSVIAIYGKDPVTASIVGGSTVVSLVAVFVTERWVKK